MHKGLKTELFSIVSTVFSPLEHNVSVNTDDVSVDEMSVLGND